MAMLSCGSTNSSFLGEREGALFLSISAAPILAQRARVCGRFVSERGTGPRFSKKELFNFPRKGSLATTRNVVLTIPRDSSSSNTSDSKDNSSIPSEKFACCTQHILHAVVCTNKNNNAMIFVSLSVVGMWQTPFGYTRKDVILIGLGVTVLGFGLKNGLEFAGFDPLQAGNVVQLVLVLGLTLGWISTYMFRVSSKDMTYAQQLRDYENKVMQKRLESLTEAELEALLEQVDEEKSRPASGEQIN